MVCVLTVSPPSESHILYLFIPFCQFCYIFSMLFQKYYIKMKCQNVFLICGKSPAGYIKINVSTRYTSPVFKFLFVDIVIRPGAPRGFRQRQLSPILRMSWWRWSNVYLTPSIDDIVSCIYEHTDLVFVNICALLILKVNFRHPVTLYTWEMFDCPLYFDPRLARPSCRKNQCFRWQL